MTGQPKAIQESQFVVPGCVSSAEGRRNYTDVQETAQWLGGPDVPAQILKDLLNRTLDSIMFGSHIISHHCGMKIKSYSCSFHLLI